MGYDDYQHLRITVENRICRATIDNPPINLADLDPRSDAISAR